MPAPCDDPRDRSDTTRRHPGTGRLPALKPDNLDPTQRAFYDSMVANEVPWAEHGGARAIAEDGSLLGPFNPSLFSPAIRAAMLGVFHADSANTCWIRVPTRSSSTPSGPPAAPTTSSTRTGRSAAPQDYLTLWSRRSSLANGPSSTPTWKRQPTTSPTS
jgi:hypothetical protein